jgi:hypothetical protein
LSLQLIQYLLGCQVEHADPSLFFSRNEASNCGPINQPLLFYSFTLESLECGDQEALYHLTSCAHTTAATSLIWEAITHSRSGHIFDVVSCMRTDCEQGFSFEQILICDLRHLLASLLPVYRWNLAMRCPPTHSPSSRYSSIFSHQAAQTKGLARCTLICETDPLYLLEFFLRNVSCCLLGKHKHPSSLPR